MVGGDYGRAVLYANWPVVIEGKTIDNLVALSANDAVRFVPKDALSFGVPEYYGLASINGVCSVRRIL